MAHLNKWITLASALFVGATGYGLYEAFGKDISITSNNPRIPLFNTLFATEFVAPTQVEEEKEPEVEIEVAVATEVEEKTEEEEQEKLIEPEIVNVQEEVPVPEKEEEPVLTPPYETPVPEPAPKVQEVTQEDPEEIVQETVVKVEEVEDEEKKKPTPTEVTKAPQPKPSLDKAETNTVIVSSEEDVQASSVQEVEAPFPNLDESESSGAPTDVEEDSAAAAQVTTFLPGEDQDFVKTLWSNSIAVRWREKLLLTGADDPSWDKKVEKANEVLKTRDIWVRGWSWWKKGTTITRDDVIYICRDAIARTPWGTWWAMRYKLYWDLTWYFCSKPNTAKPKNWWYYTVATKDKMDEQQAKESKS